MSAKQAEDKKRGSVPFHSEPDGCIVMTWPWTARQRRQAVGKRLARKQARKKARN